MTNKQNRTVELLEAILAEVKVIAAHIQESERERELQRHPIVLETAIRHSN
jgi:hypothetical protein